MIQLTRTLRFCPAGDPAAPRNNAHAAWPPTPGDGLAGVVELRITLAGEPDRATGLVLNVKEIDTAFAEHVLSALDPTRPVPAFLRHAAGAFAAALPVRVVRVALHPSPRTSTALDPADMARVTLRQQFSFSAAHRLVAPGLSEEENRERFGKCHRPSFHGHNYTLEVAASAEIDADGRALDPAELDTAVRRRVIDVLDHTNLNTDVPAFADRNPTVEHIAEVCFGLLDGHLPAGARLVEVTVGETDRTSCSYTRDA